MEQAKLDKLMAAAEHNPRYANQISDLAYAEGNRELARYARDLASQTLHAIRERRSQANPQEWTTVYWRATLTMAQLGDFDAYMLYLERNRPAKERYYMPRRRHLHPHAYANEAQKYADRPDAVEGLQKLLDNDLDELFLNMPPRVGKTTLLLMLVTFYVGLHPEISNLYTAYAGGVTNAFYDGMLEILRDPMTYDWAGIFPGHKLAHTDANATTLDIDRMKRLHSLTCRSIDANMNGSCDCFGLSIADDLVSGYEEAISNERLRKLWGDVDNNYLPRAKEQCKHLWVGTRWSTNDPIGLRLAMLESGDERFANVRYEVINIPALDDNGESNYAYDYGVGYSTAYYNQRMASFEITGDIASWLAQYMGTPIDRIGTLITTDDIHTFNGVLPVGEPDATIMSCDVAYGGGDYLSAPVGYVYGDSVYLTSVVFDNRDRDFTRPKVAKQIVEQTVGRAQFEKNNGADQYREDIEEILKQQYGYRLVITSKSQPTTKTKRQRIEKFAPDMRSRVYFLEERLRDRDYRMFMSNLLSYPIEGKAKHDDAIDSLAQLIDMMETKHKGGVKTFRRRF